MYCFAVGLASIILPWGGGVWETSGGWRPMEWEVDGGVWMPLDPIIADAEQATKAVI